MHLDHVPPRAEGAALQVQIVPGVQVVHQLLEDRLARDLLSRGDQEHLAAEVFRRAEAVDAGDARHHDDVPALEEGARGREPEPVDVVVDGGVLLDVRVRLRDVRLGLIVVVVGDEVPDRALREEALELPVELRGQRLVVRDDERGPLRRLDDVRHRERLPGARDPEQGLVSVPAADSLVQLLDRARLVTQRLIGRNQLELGRA